MANVLESLCLMPNERAYAGRGSDAYHPANFLSLLAPDELDAPIDQDRDEQVCMTAAFLGMANRAEPQFRHKLQNTDSRSVNASFACWSKKF